MIIGGADPGEQARFRELAQTTRAFALQTESPSIRAAYMALAAKWDRLADGEPEGYVPLASTVGGFI